MRASSAGASPRRPQARARACGGRFDPGPSPAAGSAGYAETPAFARAGAPASRG